MSELPTLPVRRADSHKGDYGRVLVIGGARGMSGAAALAGVAALRSGAGLVQVAVPASSQPIVAGYEPSLMSMPLPEDAEGRCSLLALDMLDSALRAATIVALGPGLGRSPGLTEFVGQLYRTLPQPMVVDADALTALAEQPTALDQPAGVRVLTPHPGEFRRLTEAVSERLPELTLETRPEWEAVARKLAARWQAVVILKGHRSLITDGTQWSHNTTGNPGMATGGSGDVLTGITAALVAQGLLANATPGASQFSAYDAARLAAHVHGLAGDLAAAELGPTSLIASDLLRFLPAAFRNLLAKS
jgi:NAD(P)H-hydrate epimerase